MGGKRVSQSDFLSYLFYSALLIKTMLSLERVEDSQGTIKVHYLFHALCILTNTVWGLSINLQYI